MVILYAGELPIRSKGAEMPSGVIVLAEDDPRLRKLYTAVLDAQGYTVMAVEDGSEAVSLLRNVRPQAIILDVMMPRMNGIEACRRARKLLVEDIPILFLTALDREEMLHQCLQAGGDDFLLKSDDLSSLIERVNYWVTKPPRVARSRRRESALAEVESHLVRAGDTRAKVEALSSETDATVRENSGLVKRARKLAQSDFGMTVQEKLYLLGYVVGVTDVWARHNRTVSMNFNDYLSAVLRETSILGAQEIQQMIDSLGDISANEYFDRAREKGHIDGSEGARRGTDHVPKSLASLTG